MTLDELIQKIRTTPDLVAFNEVINTIDASYTYTPATFTNGFGEDAVTNEAGSNEGSCKIFAFALLNNLNPAETLACFGDYYRKDVLQNPDGTDHMNIRNFMQDGWDGIHFHSDALSK